VSAINLKSKPLFSVPDGMPVVSATFPPGEDVGSQCLCAHRAKAFAQNIGNEEQQNCYVLFFKN